MLWRKKPKNQQDSNHHTSDDDAQYRWENGEWRVPHFEHWYAGNSDYQADERNYWWHQVRALWVGVAVGVATLIAAGTAGLIAYWAYEATSAAVIEARKQVNVAEDTEKRQLRAYLIATGVRFERDAAGQLKLGQEQNGSYELLIDYDIVNEGITPAYGVQQIVAVQYPFNGTIDNKEWATPGVSAYVGRQHTFGPIRTRPFTKDQIDAIRLGKGGPFAFAGQMKYRDIFKREWPTNFCFMWVLAPVEPAFISCPRWSDADRLNYAE